MTHDDEDRRSVLAQLALDQLDKPWFDPDQLDDDPETIDGLGGCRFRPPRHHRPAPLRVMLH